MKTDVVLQGLLRDRQRLLESLAPVLRRVGASNPHRAKVNARAAATRKRIRRDLRANADAIVMRVVELNELPER